MSGLLTEVGQALYGPRWQTQLARDLGVSDRTMRRWVSEGGYPEGVIADLHRLVTERSQSMNAIAIRLRERLS